MARDIADQVVVLTGASSGIGRETAAEFARRGARLVLAARGDEALAATAAEVDRLGGVALAVRTDVADADQVSQLASQTVRRFGRIDTWINNASVSAYGLVEQMSVEDIRRVIEVDLFGPIHGMTAALPHLRDTGGTIINVSSALGKRAVPLQAAYSAAKHGVVAFGEALRLELRHNNVPVEVVDVLPSSINTPRFQHAESTMGVPPRPIPPVYEPRVVARAIVAVAERPVRHVFAGGAGRLMEVAQRVSPALLDWYLLGPGRVVDRQRADGPDRDRSQATQPGRGIAKGPSEEAWRATGQYGQRSKSTSVYTEVFALHPNRGRLVAGVGLAGALAALRWAGKRP